MADTTSAAPRPPIDPTVTVDVGEASLTTMNDKAETTAVKHQDPEEWMRGFRLWQTHLICKGRTLTEPQLIEVDQWKQLQREEYKQFQDGDTCTYLNKKGFELLEQWGMDWEEEEEEEEEETEEEEEKPTLSEEPSTAEDMASKKLSVEERWDAVYADLKKFHQEHGHANVPSYENKKLSNWVHNQRKRYRIKMIKNYPNPSKNRALTDYEQEKLEALGINFELESSGEPSAQKQTNREDATVRKRTRLDSQEEEPLETEDTPSKLVIRAQEQWEDTYADLVEFHEKHGHVNVPASDKKLYGWLSNQRKRYEIMVKKKRTPTCKRRPLNSSEYHKLIALGVDLDIESFLASKSPMKQHQASPEDAASPKRMPRDGDEDSIKNPPHDGNGEGKGRGETKETLTPSGIRAQENWEHNYADLVKFHEKHGHVNIPAASHKKLNQWIQTQRVRYEIMVSKKPSPRRPLTSFEYQKLIALGVDLDNESFLASKSPTKQKQVSPEDAASPKRTRLDSDEDSIENPPHDGNGEGKEQGETKETPTPSAIRAQEQWEHNYADLVKFHEKHGHVNVLAASDKKLNDWIHKQRARYEIMVTKKPSPRRPLNTVEYQKLIALGLNLEKGTAPAGESLQQQRQANSEDAVAAASPKRTRLDSVRATSPTGKKDSMINSADDREEEQEEPAEPGGEPSTSIVHAQENWEHMFAALKRFRDQHGHINVVKHGKLHRWIRYQRERNKITNLGHPANKKGRPFSKDEREKLVSLGVDLELPAKQEADPVPARKQADPEDSSPLTIDTGSITHKNIRQKWEAMYNELKEFQRKHGHLHVTRRDGQKLQRWMASQRERYKIMVDKDYPNPYKIRALTQDEKEKLVALGVNLEEAPPPRQAPPGGMSPSAVLAQERWNDMYKELKKYRRKHGHVLAKARGDASSLGKWITSQRFRYRLMLDKDHPNPHQIRPMTRNEQEKLVALGVVLEKEELSETSPENHSNGLEDSSPSGKLTRKRGSKSDTSATPSRKRMR